MGNLLSAIGRSQAIPQFIEQARLARKDELAAGMAQEHLNLAKSADARAQIASEGQNAMTEEQLKALRFESQKKQEEEAFLTNPTDMKTFLQSNTPNQSVATAAEEYLRANGLVDNIGGGDVINRKNYNRFIEDAQKNPMVQNNINDANLKSARTYLSTVQAAINGDKDAMNTLKQKDPKFNEKMLPEAEKDAQMNLDQALLSSQHLTKFQAEQIRVKELAAKKDTNKEVNVANEVDTVLGGMFPGYYTDKNVRQKALEWYGQPGNADKVKAEIVKLNQDKAPKIYNFVPTSEGFVPGNVRTGKMGSPATSPEDGTTYGKPIPAGEITPIQQVQTLKTALATAKSLYDPKFVGPVAGRAASVNRAYLGGAGQSERQVIFNASLEQSRNSLVYLLSGKQINETEFKRLDKQLPSVTLAPKAFSASMKEFERTLDSILKTKQDALKSGGYGTQDSKNNSPVKTPSKTVPEQNAQGWLLYTDADGNKAYVSPDGKQIEEVK